MARTIWQAALSLRGAVRKAMHKRGYGQWFAITVTFALKIDVFLTVSAALATVHHRKYWKNVRYSLTDKNELVVIGLGTITKLSTVTTCNVRPFHVQ